MICLDRQILLLPLSVGAEYLLLFLVNVEVSYFLYFFHYRGDVLTVHLL